MARISILTKRIELFCFLGQNCWLDGANGIWQESSNNCMRAICIKYHSKSETKTSEKCEGKNEEKNERKNVDTITQFAGNPKSNAPQRKRLKSRQETFSGGIKDRV